MLPSKKEISDSKPPYLLQYSSGGWDLILKIATMEDSLELTTINTKSDNPEKSKIIIPKEPFHVGADIWELGSYSILMTLIHPTLLHHPANDLWGRWKLINNN